MSSRWQVTLSVVAALGAVACHEPAGPPSAATVSVAPNVVTLAPDSSVTLKALVLDARGRELPGAPVMWRSADLAIATVDAHGVVTGVAEGSTTVTATSGRASGTVAVSVRPVVAQVVVGRLFPSLFAGDTTQLVATVLAPGGGEVTGRATTWSTRAPHIATVSPGGIVAGVSQGLATIVAETEGTRDSVVVAVLVPRIRPNRGLVFNQYLSGTAIGDSLWILDTPGSVPRRLNPPDLFLITGVNWAPEGDRFVAGAGTDTTPPDAEYAFTLFTLDPRGLTAVPRATIPIGDLSWAPDGASLVGVENNAPSSGPANWVLRSVDAATLARRTVLSGPAFLEHPEVSPDGRQIAFTRGGPDGVPAELWLVATDGSRARRIDLAWAPAIPHWSPDGKMIAFRMGNGDGLGVVNTDGSHARVLDLGHFEGAPSWSPEGRRLAWMRHLPEQLVLVDVDGSHRVELDTGPSTLIMRPSWSPDGEWVAFNATPPGEGANVGTVVRRDGSARQALGVQGRNRVFPSWRP